MSPNESALVTRWESFVQKTQQRFDETLTESTQLLIEQLQDTDYDYQTVFRTWSAVKNQIFQLIDTIDNAWNHKVEPLLKKEGDAWYTVRLSVGDIENNLHQRLEVHDLYIQGKLSELQYQHLLPNVNKDYNCTQCGAIVRINPKIFRAQYITCNACNTTNTIDLETNYVHLVHQLESIAAYQNLELFKTMQSALAELQAERPPAPEHLWNAYQTAYENYQNAKLESLQTLRTLSEEEVQTKREKFQNELNEFINIQKHNKYGEN
ncbi:hypothetical protein [Paenimyroides aestuarii]|uniref:Uncharacterized protein n=1 Tax=Paenimyroides aestuarii TaxID=2968490 RepID=A0ABY5NUW7_9FLAO|nr:hypothetical protein [Paenimyroides aestuarii]UUV22375.1 hypothetical protein NPX36_04870 [Paenimyroides aestuarii]